MATTTAEATVNQISHIGVQPDNTVGVPALVRTGTFAIEVTPNPEMKVVQPGGYKYPTKTYKDREWATVALSGGSLDYNESFYAFASGFGTTTTDVLRAPVAAVPASGTPGDPDYVAGTPAVEGIYRHTIRSSTHKRDRSYALTVAHGTIERAQRVTGVALTDLGFTANNTNGETALTGSGIARAVTYGPQDGYDEDGERLDTLVEWDGSPIRAGDLNIHVSETLAGLAETEPVDWVRSVTFSVGGKKGPNWVLKRDLKSYKDLVELAPDFTLEFVCQAGEEGEYLTQVLNDGDRIYVHLDFRGEELGTVGGTTHYQRFQVTVPCDVAGLGARNDGDGVWQQSYTLRPAHDKTFGGANEVVFVNNVPALPAYVQ